MIDLLSAFGYEFFRNAVIAGVLASITCGIIGSFVVVKRLVSLAGGIAHAAFGGIGLGYFLGFSPIAGAALFSVFSAAVIAKIRQVSTQHMDTLIGAVWAGGMALGVMFVYLTPGFAPDLMGYLFGNILLVPSYDLWIMAALLILIITVVCLLYKQIMAVTFDEEYAAVMNLKADYIMMLLLILTALTIVMLIQVVGIILVIALLSLPAAVAREYTGRLSRMFCLSAVLGTVFTLAGIILSYEFNVPSGASIILISAAVYVCVIIAKALRRRYAVSRY